MASVRDLWRKRDGTPTARDGRGLRWRVTVEGYPSTSHRTRAEADRVLQQRLVAGPPVVASDALLDSLLDRWLATKRGLSPRGFEACQYAAGVVRPQWGGRVAESITRPEIAEWVAGLSVAASTKAKLLQALSGALQIGVEDGLLARNVAAGVRPGRQVAAEAVFLTAQQLGALVEESHMDSRALVWWLGLVGTRIGETVALVVGDVQPGVLRARVRRSKNGEARDVSVPAELVGMLDLDRSPRAPLFPTPTGLHWGVRNWRSQRFYPARDLASVPGSMRVHDLRHTAASLMIAAGADIKAVQRQLGHKTIAMTIDRYGHLFDASLDRVGVLMSGVLGTAGVLDRAG